MSRFGLVDLAPDCRVERFREKPQVDDWASAGFFAFDHSVFDHIPSDETLLEQSPLVELAAAGQLAAYRHEGFWQPIDT